MDIRTEYKNFVKTLPFTILTCIVFLAPVLMQITRNNYVKLLEDMAYLLMLAISVYMLVRNKNISVIVKPVMGLFIMSIIIFAIVGVYYNGTSMIILQFRELKYLLLLIIMLPYTDKVYFKHVWTTLKVIGALSVPVAIVQWVVYQTNGDYVTGLLGYGGSGTLTIYVLVIFFTELGMRLKDNTKIIGFYFLYLIPTAINETKITIFLFPAILFVILILTKKFKIHTVFAAVLVLSLLFGIWASSYESIYGKHFTEVFSAEYIESYLFATTWDVDAGRFTKILYAIDAISDNNLLFGYGLGASYSGATSGIKGYALKEFYDVNIMEGTRPQLFISLFETGVVGTLIILIFLFYIFVRLVKIKGIMLEKLVAINCLVIILITYVYQHIFYTYQVMYIFVFYTFMSLRVCSRNNEILQDGEGE